MIPLGFNAVLICSKLTVPDLEMLGRTKVAMRKTIATVILIALISAGAFSFTLKAKADDGRIAAGVAGGILGGVLLGGAIANGGPVYAAPPPPPVYYQPAPAYVEEPDCRFVPERYWDGYAYRVRRVQVCD